MNALVLTEWFARHHPTVTVDPDRWAGTLPTHEPHELIAALDRWCEMWPPDVAPKPAQVGALIRDARTAVARVDDRARADAALAELRRLWPRRSSADRARMIDESRERRQAPPLNPRKAS